MFWHRTPLTLKFPPTYHPRPPLKLGSKFQPEIKKISSLQTYSLLTYTAHCSSAAHCAMPKFLNKILSKPCVWKSGISGTDSSLKFLGSQFMFSLAEAASSLWISVLKVSFLITKLYNIYRDSDEIVKSFYSKIFYNSILEFHSIFLGISQAAISAWKGERRDFSFMKNIRSSFKKHPHINFLLHQWIPQHNPSHC